MNSTSAGPGLFAALRGFVRKRAAKERCELCAAALPPEHRHLVEPDTRRLVCACRACALLFDGRSEGRYRAVPERIQLLEDFRLTDATWDELHVPINLAFLFRSTPAKRVIAIYPSPAGATESLLPLEAWRDLEADNPVLAEFEPDVEALLVNRVGSVRDHYRVPIDECYKLVGLLRTHWRGLSGGTQVWQAIAAFFADLRNRSQNNNRVCNA
ncbi:MAG TPA: DUF5947 family protein [Gemmataceae bacterium]|nr:DUF5947 family protein [Gemmataceae bacterium]